MDRKHLREAIMKAHPDKRDGKEDKRGDFEDALRKLRKVDFFHKFSAEIKVLIIRFIPLERKSFPRH